MINAIFSIFNYISDIMSLLDQYAFSFNYGVGVYSVSILDIFIIFIVVGMVVSIFWRGARG